MDFHVTLVTFVLVLVGLIESSVSFEYETLPTQQIQHPELEYSYPNQEKLKQAMSVEETNTSALNESLLKGVDPVPFQGDIEEEGGNRGLEQAWSTGETQPYKCRDRFWACLFLVQFLGVATLAIVWGIPALNYSYASSSDEAPSAIHFGGVICTCLLAGTGALAITSLALTVMIQWSEVLIQISVIFSMVSSVALMVACIFIGEAVGAAFAFILFCLASLYACSIWSSIFLSQHPT